ncbi:hypothetical protein SDC9_143819 [bioreactor metagenome]|uniref:Uncharacterized protein n=1 Tax=bioreactor metagenome TaxID=1076179 RepID=A0A645E4F0_9ZZZZ
MRRIRAQRGFDGICPGAVALHRCLTDLVLAIVDVDRVTDRTRAAERGGGVVGGRAAGQIALRRAYIVHRLGDGGDAGSRCVHRQREVRRHGVLCCAGAARLVIVRAV